MTEFELEPETETRRNGSKPERVKRPSRAQAEDAVRTLLAWAGDDPQRQGLLETPRRVVCAYEDRTSPAEVRGVTIPTLVASGANTTYASLRVCDVLASTIPQARGLRIPGAGHSPMRSHPDHFAGALRELIASVE